MSAHAYLRGATRAAHDQVDAMLSSFDLRDPTDYGRFLAVQSAAFLPIENALDASGAASVMPDWKTRRRGAFLLDDLAALGITPPPAVPAPAFDTREAILGGIYVLEGSRLGGAMLSRDVDPDLPQQFLAGSPVRGGWKSLLELLEHNLSSGVQLQRAGESAIMAFQSFITAASARITA